ncbi:MAG: hypothetical protein ACXWUX_04230 [Allosphingosinicella sp.]
MNLQPIVAAVLAGMLVAYVALHLFLALRRRRARAAAVRDDLLKHQAQGAWQRLHDSAAGAP